MAEESVWKVTDYFLVFTHEHGDFLSNLKLQKLLYYAQAWFLAIHDRPLFEDSIEAWVHGPVVPAVYSAYKKWTWRPIDEHPEMPALSDVVKEHLDEVLEVYGPMAAFQLERLTHEEDPWKNARGGIPADEVSHAVISTDDMKQFYRRRMND